MCVMTGWQIAIVRPTFRFDALVVGGRREPPTRYFDGASLALG